jgi:CRP-like cAMP-binding protein
MLSVMQLNSRIRLRGELALGRQELKAKFDSSPPRILRSGELLAVAVGSRDAIYHLRAGWACQFRDLPNGRRAIVDIYLPGDVIGLDAAIRARRSEEILTLTSVTVETIHARDALIDLTASQSTALYIAWLLAQRQRRANRLLAAFSCLDARGRLATMLLDFYTRLRRGKLINVPEYNLPLTQTQIGNYLGLTAVHVNRMLQSLRDEAQQAATLSSITDDGERPLSESAD